MHHRDRAADPVHQALQRLQALARPRPDGRRTHLSETADGIRQDRNAVGIPLPLRSGLAVMSADVIFYRIRD